MFETKSVLGREFYKKLFTMIDSKWSTKLYFFGLFGMLTLAVLVPFSFLPHGVYLWLVFAVAFLIYAIYRYKGRADKFADNFIASNREHTDSDSLSYITSLGDDGVHYKNLVTQAEGVVKYEYITTVYDIDGYYYLVSKSGRGLPVNKTLLTDQERKDCVQYLKSKLNKVKWEI